MANLSDFLRLGYSRKSRGVAQFGSALDWGSSGRRFKSCRPDHFSDTEQRLIEKSIWSQFFFQRVFATQTDLADALNFDKSDLGRLLKDLNADEVLPRLDRVLR